MLNPIIPPPQAASGSAQNVLFVMPFHPPFSLVAASPRCAFALNSCWQLDICRSPFEIWPFGKISSPGTPGTPWLLDNLCFLWEPPPELGVIARKEKMKNRPFNGAVRLYPKDQPQRIGLSYRIASVPRRRSFHHVAAIGPGGTVALPTGRRRRPAAGRRRLAKIKPNQGKSS
jgi:hypothetical protein